MTDCRLPEAVLTVRHPGPIVSYTWGEHDLVIPPWLFEQIVDQDARTQNGWREFEGRLVRIEPIEAAMLHSIATTAVPHRYDFDRGQER